MHFASDHGFDASGQHPESSLKDRIATSGPNRIPGDISDLFFNTDVSDAKTYRQENGRTVFDGFDEAKLLDAARQFCETFERASGIIVSPNDLMQDFLGRI